MVPKTLISTHLGAMSRQIGTVSQTSISTHLGRMSQQSPDTNYNDHAIQKFGNRASAQILNGHKLPPSICILSIYIYFSLEADPPYVQATGVAAQYTHSLRKSRRAGLGRVTFWKRSSPRVSLTSSRTL
jgi:hypothetical protein